MIGAHACLCQYYRPKIFSREDIFLNAEASFTVLLVLTEQFTDLQKYLDISKYHLFYFSDNDLPDYFGSSKSLIIRKFNSILDISYPNHQPFLQKDFLIFANSSVMWLYSSLQNRNIILIERNLRVESLIFDESSCAVILSLREILQMAQNVDEIDQVMKNVVNNIADLSFKYEYCFVLTLVEEEFVSNLNNENSDLFLSLQARLIASFCIGFPLKVEVQFCFSTQDLLEYIEKDLEISIRRKYGSCLTNEDIFEHNSIVNSIASMHEFFLSSFPFINTYISCNILRTISLKEFLSSSYEYLTSKLGNRICSHMLGRACTFKDNGVASVSYLKTSIPKSYSAKPQPKDRVSHSPEELMKVSSTSRLSRNLSDVSLGYFKNRPEEPKSKKPRGEGMLNRIKNQKSKMFLSNANGINCKRISV